MKLREFYDRCAASYDDDYLAAGYTGDVPLYVELAGESGGPVLEMGCGTGRVLLEVARAGTAITGVELSAGMLARAEERLAGEPEAVRERVRLVRGDIRTVDARAREDERFALVTAPFRVVQHLVTRDDQRAWLRNVRRHLAPTGSLAFDVFQPNYELIAEGDHTAVDVERTDRETGETVRRVSRSVYHPELQTFEVSFEWLVGDGGAGDRSERSITTTVRWFTLPELENLLELEGFRVDDRWGDFERTPFGEGAEDIVVRARLL